MVYSLLRRRRRGVRPPILLSAIRDGVPSAAITHTRPYDAYEVSSGGVLTLRGSGVIRGQHYPIDPTTGQRIRTTLLEGARMNRFAYTTDLTDAVWQVIRITRTVNAATAPHGATTATLVVPTTSSGNRYVLQDTPSLTAGQVYTDTWYVRAAGYEWVQLTGSNGFPQSWVNFNISTGAQGNSSLSAGEIARITALGDGWYRISLTLTVSTSVSSGRMILVFLPDNSTTRLPGWAGDGTSGYYLWGPQRENASFASSYIRNPGTGTASRATDTATVDAPAGELYQRYIDRATNTWVDSIQTVAAGNRTLTLDREYQHAVVFQPGITLAQARAELGVAA
jgi:hypothetical protein